jgi:multiple sugar transport system substrate-binding protein
MSSFGPNRTRRSFLIQFAAAGGAMIAAACAPPEPTPRAKTDATPPAAAQPGATQPAEAKPVAPAQTTGAGTITFVNWEDIKDTPFEETIQAFERASGRKVEVQPTPGRGTEYETKIRVMLAGGTVPDIMRTNDDFVRYYSIKDQILDLRPYLEKDRINPDDYYKPIFDFAKQPDGKYTAWSLGNQPRVIFYNVNMFKEAGVPVPPKDWTDAGWKWDDFLDRAKKLTVPGQRWGALLYDDTGMEQTFVVNNGEEEGLYSADGKRFTLANPKGAEAIQWLADLTCKHQVQPERGLVSQPDSGNNLFAAGRIAMMSRASSVVSYLRKNVKDFEWDVAPIPGNVHQKVEGSLICYTITKAAKNPDGAWELLKFMGGPEGGKIFAEGGAFIPAFKAAAEYVKPTNEPPANIELFSKAMAVNVNVNFTENTERARNIYRQELDLVYTCQGQAQETLNRVKGDVEAALAGKF